MRRYVAFALDKAHPVVHINDLLDDELELILSLVPLVN